MEFSRQEYWSGLPFPLLVDLPNPGIKPGSPVLHREIATQSHAMHLKRRGPASAMGGVTFFPEL